MAWAQASGRGSLPASPEDVAAYLEDRSADGCEAFNPASGGGGDSAQSQGHRFRRACPPWRRPDRAGRADTGRSPPTSRALPLDLNCYLAIRKTAHEPRWGRGGRLERAASARNRGAVDIAMIGLMRDARLRVSEAAALTWGDVRRLRGGSGHVRVGGAGEDSYRVVSADTMKLLLPIRRGAGDHELVLGMKPNQIARRIGAAARQAGLGEGYSGDSPRLGMIRDMETLGVQLLGGYAAERAR